MKNMEKIGIVFSSFLIFITLFFALQTNLLNFQDTSGKSFEKLLSSSSNSSNSRVSPSPTFSHNPSENFSGHLNSDQYITYRTTIKDPQTIGYTIKLVGPDSADFDLYVNKGDISRVDDAVSIVKGNEVQLNNFDYKSVSPKSKEQIDISNPALGNYTTVVLSNSGEGDYVLYFNYTYNNT